MNDEELANELVAAGIGGVIEKSDWINEKGDYTIGGNSMDAKQFVYDWRVAGAVMEKCTNVRIMLAMNDKDWRVSAGIDKATEGCRNESLPRAINEAGVEALKS